MDWPDGDVSGIYRSCMERCFDILSRHELLWLLAARFLVSRCGPISTVNINSYKSDKSWVHAMPGVPGSFVPDMGH